ncbi:dihydrolipoyllysine-residue acetyltransferase [Rhizobium leguminosarum]|uniref:dihydrolipoyllysine-residue acetyltransferase n=1 Tax=Rhizobium leguminosarum TaxID=384 RepID=UPI001AE7347F|nr:dihydrolipoyllysine-residue acetyltransferase [Rhizobium leguminosarum]MBP2449870.1 pyruvate dehydrogenase E2 component (dihydrolipoamide acetyltransferase) [Rhizobium leguminosarum]
MSAIQKIYLPDIGDYKDVPIVEITVKPGDVIAVDDPIITLETDKATMEVPSPVAGCITTVLVEIGAKVSQGVAIAEIDAAGAVASVASPSPAVEAPVEASAPAASVAPETKPAGPAAASAVEPVASSDGTTGALLHATPSVRAYARELGVDLARVKATGPKGRILREDVQNFVKGELNTPKAVAPSAGNPAFAGLPAWPQIDFSKFGEIEKRPLTRIQEISGASLARNYLTIPHVTNFDNADVTELESFRTQLNGEKRNPPVKLTMVAFLLKASALALKAYPQFNSSLTGNELTLKKYVNIGFAVDTPKGLMVPVIKDCDKKGLIEIGQEMGVLAEKAREGALSPTDMQGGCFSVSSLGGIGGTGFTPIINAPEVAILGAARSVMQAVWNGKEFEPRLIMPISLSWDHRVVDGVAAARFLGHISSILGDFRRAIL